MGHVLDIIVRWEISLIAAGLLLDHTRDLFIAWYNGVDIAAPFSTMVRIGLQMLVNIAAIWLALTAA